MEKPIRIVLKPETAKLLAKNKAEKLTDAQAAAIWKEIRPALELGCAGIQNGYRDKARAAYAKSGAPQLFQSFAQDLVDTLAVSAHDLKDGKAGHCVMPDSADFANLEKMLSTCAILCYPCYALSETLGDREMLARAMPFLRNGLTTRNVKRLGDLTRDDILLLRDRTDETALQEKLFEALSELCFAAARRMKSAKAREEAMLWMDVNDLVLTRDGHYDLRLPPEDAKRLVATLKEAYRRLGRIMRYESL